MSIKKDYIYDVITGNDGEVNRVLDIRSQCGYKIHTCKIDNSKPTIEKYGVARIYLIFERDIIEIEEET